MMRRTILSLLFFLVIAVLAAAQVNKTDENVEVVCGQNESSKLCGRMCEPTCDNPNPNPEFCPTIVCTQLTRGCRCAVGFYRSISEGCLHLEDCPNK